MVWTDKVTADPTSIREDWRRNNIENVSILSDEQRGIWFISFQRVSVRQFIQKERMIRSVEVITYIYNNQKDVKPELMDSDNTINESLLL